MYGLGRHNYIYYCIICFSSLQFSSPPPAHFFLVPVFSCAVVWLWRICQIFFFVPVFSCAVVWLWRICQVFFFFVPIFSCAVLWLWRICQVFFFCSYLFLCSSMALEDMSSFLFLFLSFPVQFYGSGGYVKFSFFVPVFSCAVVWLWRICQVFFFCSYLFLCSSMALEDMSSFLFFVPVFSCAVLWLWRICQVFCYFL